MDKLAIIYREHGRVEEAEELEVYYKTKLGANHPDALRAKVYRRLVDELSVAIPLYNLISSVKRSNR